MKAQVRTYDVVPITSSLGIVEFVPGTRPLKDAICTFVPEEVIFLHFHLMINLTSLTFLEPAAKQHALCQRKTLDFISRMTPLTRHELYSEACVLMTYGGCFSF